MKLVLTGIQGAGKSTQGNLLSKELRIPYLSTGHIFREISKERTTLGRYVKEIITAGELVPDKKTIEIVDTYLGKPQYKRGYILDGFPRTLHQAKMMNDEIEKVIYLEIPDKEALWRLAYRDDVERDDNTIQAIRNRIEAFHRYTDPVIAYYAKQNKLIHIDGMLSIQEVNVEILKSLGKEFVEKHLRSWDQKRKSIIALVGLAGSGKSEASLFFKSKDVPVVSYGKIINDYVDEHKLEQTEAVHSKLRVEFRQKYGNAAMSVLSQEKLKKALEKHVMVVIDDLKSWEEYQYLRDTFKDTDVYIVAMFAEKKLRYERAAKRGYRPKLYGEERDINELMHTNEGPTIAFADFIIVNNDSKDELNTKLERIYNSIYFA